VWGCWGSGEHENGKNRPIIGVLIDTAVIILYFHKRVRYFS